MESDSQHTLGWLKNWRPWLAAWRSLNGSFQDFFQSPFILKADLHIADVSADIFTVKKGRQYLLGLQLASLVSPITERHWFLLHNLPLDNHVKETTWRYIHNALPIGERIRFFTDSSCLWCINTYQDRQHFLLDCPVAKSVWTAMEKITTTKFSCTFWQSLCNWFLNTKDQPSLSIHLCFK